MRAAEGRAAGTGEAKAGGEGAGTGAAERKPAFDTIETIGLLVVTPTALLSGWLYYFGWVRTGALFGRFGIEQTMLGYGGDDYLLRSAGVAFLPLLAILVVTGAVLALHAALTRHGGGPALAVGPAGLLLVAVGCLCAAQVTPGVPPLAGAAALGVGALLTESAATLRGWREARLRRRVLIAGLCLVSVFWSCAVYAQQTGERVAGRWAADPRLRPAVVIVSATDLALTGPGIVRERTPGGFRYTGLRLLVFSNERWFLIPAGWTPGATAVILPDTGSIRVEVGTGG